MDKPELLDLFDEVLTIAWHFIENMPIKDRNRLCEIRDNVVIFRKTPQPKVSHQIVKVERWAFMKDELDKLPQCRGDDEFVAYPPECEIGVIVYRNGNVSNRWADGTVGLSPELVEAAFEEETVFRDREEFECWRNVGLDENDLPIAFMPIDERDDLDDKTNTH